MTYHDFFLGTAAIFALFIIAGVISLLLEWRARRKASAWCKRDLEARGIYIEGEPDHAAKRGSIREFEAIKRMYPK